MTIRQRVAAMPRELRLFVAASFAMGAAGSIIDATFNNFLDARFQLTGFTRAFLELPRELPGLLVVFAVALLWFLCSRRVSALAMLLCGLGAVLIGFASWSYAAMVVWLFLFSLGQHLYMPMATTIGMELAKEGKTGQRLGQLNAVRNVAIILGSLLVYVGFHALGFTFSNTFALAALVFAVAAALFYAMKRQRRQRPAMHLKLHREYWLYYVLSILFGSRKQLFITFAPWVLVTVFHEPTETLATLLLIGGVIGIGFQPFLGWATDRLGERFVLAAEAVLLVFVCLGYGFARRVFSAEVAFYVTCGCFLLDQMLMAVGMARSTFMKKIALRPADIQPALTMAISIDHVFSMAVALLGGLIWNACGYEYVFLLGVAIAAVNFVFAMQVRVPVRSLPGNIICGKGL